jgi:hypothetical protein
MNHIFDGTSYEVKFDVRDGCLTLQGEDQRIHIPISEREFEAVTDCQDSWANYLIEEWLKDGRGEIEERETVDINDSEYYRGRPDRTEDDL